MRLIYSAHNKRARGRSYTLIINKFLEMKMNWQFSRTLAVNPVGSYILLENARTILQQKKNIKNFCSVNYNNNKKKNYWLFCDILRIYLVRNDEKKKTLKRKFTIMTAETLKPFISLPNQKIAIVQQNDQTKSAIKKTRLYSCYAFVLILCLTILGMEVCTNKHRHTHQIRTKLKATVWL